MNLSKKKLLSVKDGQQWLLHKLSLRDWPNVMLVQKMRQQGASDEVISAVIDWATQFGYLNEHRFFTHWVKHKMTQGYGFYYLQHQMKLWQMPAVWLDDILTLPDTLQQTAYYYYQARQGKMSRSDRQWLQFFIRRGHRLADLTWLNKHQHEKY